MSSESEIYISRKIILKIEKKLISEKGVCQFHDT